MKKKLAFTSPWQWLESQLDLFGKLAKVFLQYLNMIEHVRMLNTSTYMYIHTYDVICLLMCDFVIHNTATVYTVYVWNLCFSTDRGITQKLSIPLRRLDMLSACKSQC